LNNLRRWRDQADSEISSAVEQPAWPQWQLSPADFGASAQDSLQYRRPSCTMPTSLWQWQLSCSQFMGTSPVPWEQYACLGTVAPCLLSRPRKGGSSSMIRKLPSGEYRLYSRKKDPKTGRRRNLGTFKSLAAAQKHERAVQFFKRA
jgi:hypothetical protein